MKLDPTEKLGFFQAIGYITMQMDPSCLHNVSSVLKHYPEI